MISDMYSAFGIFFAVLYTFFPNYLEEGKGDMGDEGYYPNTYAEPPRFYTR
jgi:hypothetical protein